MDNTAILDEVKKILNKHLEIKGLRKTPERYAIIDEIYSFNKHFSADELYSKMINKKYRSFICGIKGKVLSDREKKFLIKYKPWGIILFSRNIESIAQTQKLTKK